MYKTILVNVDELWLKGRNRKTYVQALISHIRNFFKAYGVLQVDIHNHHNRLVVESKNFFDEEVILGLANLPGIHSIIPARTVDIVTKEELAELVKEEVAQFIQNSGLTTVGFKVNTYRTNKKYPDNSMQVDRWIGHILLKTFKELKVDVHKPHMSLEIKIHDTEIHFSCRKIMGPGGLPVGTSGRAITMLSGGIDSPVASFMMAKRGLAQSFAFFYAHPYVASDVKDKIIELMKIIGRFQNGCKLYVIPFGEIQKQISKDCEESYRTLIFRRFMVEISNLMATFLKADCLITGDSLSQVSSQTITNIAAIDSISKKPILRPLIGMNKQDIMNIGRHIGTYETSIIPHDDACALFAPKSPIIHCRMDYWEEFKANFDYSELLEKAIKTAEVYQVNQKGHVEKISGPSDNSVRQ